MVYGWNTIDSAFLVSRDGGDTWDERSQESIFDFVVDPDDTDHILATSPIRPGEFALLRSQDGGRSWDAIDDVPTLTRLAWTEEGRLLGASPDGVVWRSDAGEDWETQGSIGGFPEALLVTGEAAYAAADGTLVVSHDDGAGWDVVLRYH